MGATVQFHAIGQRLVDVGALKRCPPALIGEMIGLADLLIPSLAPLATRLIEHQQHHLGMRGRGGEQEQGETKDHSLHKLD